MGLETVAVLTSLIACALVLAHPRWRGARTWRATVTPLASIIGSGFLVLAPLLAATVGGWAPVAVLGIVAVAYGIGASLRFNIRHVEPVLAGEDPPGALVDLERVSRVALSVAYTISVAFYLRLLSSFVLEGLGVDSARSGRVLTTAVLVLIGGLGLARGLHGIEAVELPAVDLKLAVIAALLAGMVVFDLQHAPATVDAFGAHPAAGSAVDVARRLAGMLLIVQGFETSRYLGHYYGPELRVTTMRAAQLVSGAIYVGFAVLVVPFFDDLGSGPQETAILDAARLVSPVLVPLLVLAAVASQLSAATADTAGGSEMLTERPRHVAGGHLGYPVVAFGAALVAWFTDIFAIVAFASRAFAAYYLCQALITAVAAGRGHGTRRRVVVPAALALALGLLVVVVAAVPGD